MTAVRVRLDATGRPPAPGEIRLTGPLDPPGGGGSTRPLPRADRPSADAAIASIHDLHAGLAAANADPAWWYLPVSEWQPAMSALPGIVEDAARIRALDGGAAYVLAVADPIAARYLERLFADDAAVHITVRPADRLVWLLRRVKLPMLRWVNMALWLVEHVRNRAAVRRQTPPRRAATRIDTLFVSRFERDLEAGVPAGAPWKDRYLGDLPAEGHGRTGSVALVGRCGANAGRIAAAVSGYRPFPVSTTYEWLSAADLLGIARRALAFRLRASDRGGALAAAAVAESRSHVRALADCLLVERALAAAIRALGPRRIVSMQENSVWEHAVVLAARAEAPDAALTGFFHCPVMPSAFRYRGRADVMSRRPLFDRTIPLGPNMAAALCALGDWRPRLVAGYGFRNPELDGCFALDAEPAAGPFRILVVLGGMFDNAAFLAWIDRARDGLDDVVFEIRPHPAFPADAALARAGIALHPDGPFRLSVAAGMDEALAGVGCAVYKGSTAGIASLAAGVPVIHVDDGGIASDDCLFDAGPLRASVADAADFRRKIDAIRGLSPADRRAWRQAARDYVRGYYDLTDTSRAAALEDLFAPPAAPFENRGDNQGAAA